MEKDEVEMRTTEEGKIFKKIHSNFNALQLKKDLL